MLIKLVALGTLGYVGYKFLQSAGRGTTGDGTSASDLRLAGGPLSGQASVQPTPDAPPVRP
jgi:hypothetical protein